MPGATSAPAASHAMKKAYELVTTGQPQTSGIPRAMVLTVSFVVSLVNRAFLPPSPATMRKHCRRLDTSVGVSGRHDFAVRDRHIRLMCHRVHRIPRSTFVTIAKRPSLRSAGRAEKCF